MEIFGVVENYGNNSITVESIKIVKETKKMFYLADRVQWLGYSKQIQKDDPRVYLSTKDAIAAYIADKDYLIDNLQKRLDGELARRENAKLCQSS